MTVKQLGVRPQGVSGTTNMVGLAAENFIQGKVFAGADLNLGFSNLDKDEANQIGDGCYVWRKDGPVKA